MKVHYIQLYISSLLFPLIIAKKKEGRQGKRGRGRVERERGKGRKKERNNFKLQLKILRLNIRNVSLM